MRRSLLRIVNGSHDEQPGKIFEKVGDRFSGLRALQGETGGEGLMEGCEG
jgi:hypothetical protein